jgi:bacillithiol system protein YtxJ
MSGLVPLNTIEDLDRVLAEDVAVIYKHSTQCGLSARTLQQMLSFVADHPDVPVYKVNVVEDRPVSDAVARRLAIPHESPQAIVLRRGAPVWNGSHLDVTAEKLSAALEGSR